MLDREAVVVEQPRDGNSGLIGNERIVAPLIQIVAEDLLLRC